MTLPIVSNMHADISQDKYDTEIARPPEDVSASVSNFPDAF